MISVVIPVYNVENYLEECVYSVINQSYSSIEIILVDDGSTDSSGSICDNLKMVDSRIKVFHKTNGGLSDARNYGLLKASGEYIMFLDSDDYWGVDFLHEVVQIIEANEGIDFITADTYLGIYPKGKVIKKECEFDEETFVYEGGEKFLEFVLSYRNKNQYIWHWNAWRNVYRRELLLENNLLFKKGILNEDAEWTPRVILKSHKFGLYKRPFYMYRLSRPNSIMNVISSKKIIDYLCIVDGWINYAESIDNLNLSQKIKSRFSNDFFSYLYGINLLDKADRDQIIVQMKKSKFLTHVNEKKYIKYKKMINVIGIKSVLFMMSFKYKLKRCIKSNMVKYGILDR